jgi:uncharacterized glyoxalase superfamily protein PhnB
MSGVDASKIAPEDVDRCLPQLTVSDAKHALQVYEKAFGGTVKSKFENEEGFCVFLFFFFFFFFLPFFFFFFFYSFPFYCSGKIMHSEISILKSTFFVVDDFPEFNGGQPSTPHDLKGASVALAFRVPDVDAQDAVVKRAVGAGFFAEMPPTDCFFFGFVLAIRDFARPVWPQMDLLNSSSRRTGDVA